MWAIISCQPSIAGIRRVCGDGRPTDQVKLHQHAPGGTHSEPQMPQYPGLVTDDFWRDFNPYKAKGVAFVCEPKTEAYETVAV